MKYLIAIHIKKPIPKISIITSVGDIVFENTFISLYKEWILQFYFWILIQFLYFLSLLEACSITLDLQLLKICQF